MFFPVLTLQVNLKLQKILVGFSERLKQGFIRGGITCKSFRWRDGYYSEEPVGVCMLSKIVFCNNGVKGCGITSKNWCKNQGIGKEVLQNNCSSL